MRGLIVVLLAFVLAGLAGPAAAAAGTGRLRVAHLSRDTPAVDVTLLHPGEDARKGDVVARSSGYGTVTPYRELPAGRYAVAIRAAGASTDTPPVLSAFVDLPAGGARTIAVSGPFAELSVHVIADDLGTPPAGTARAQVLVGTTGAAPTVTVDGAPLPAAVRAGAATLEVDVPGGPPTRLPLHLAAGSVVSLVVLQAPDGGLSVHPVVDAAAPAGAPTGAVPAGGGPVAPVGLLLGGALAAMALRRRQRVLPLAATVGLALLPAPVASAAERPVVPPAVTLEGLSVPKVRQPVRVRVPAAGIDGPLTAVGLDPRGTLVPPDDVGSAGWLADGPAPGEIGPAVLAGHVNGGGRSGLFARLDEVTVDDEVLVTGADGVERRFRVTAIDHYPKSAFPASAVYAATTDAELRLVTCGGPFDALQRSYTENVVVSARLTG